ncbi:hypothetical protein ACTXJX_14980 [Glutamicibacter ardleyensis]|uniref:hypothetical protein n=1 Tax=Glutamicibacter ardleyensis TaxID=225894 RepID=UPI003FD1239D
MAGRKIDSATGRTMRDSALEARRFQAEWLLLVASEEASLSEVIEEACTEDGASLRKIRLVSLLTSQPRWGEKKALQVLNLMISVLKVKAEPKEITIGWLVDSRSGGRRLQAWTDALQPKAPAWRGFPFSPRPRAESE